MELKYKRLRKLLIVMIISSGLFVFYENSGSGYVSCLGLNQIFSLLNLFQLDVTSTELLILCSVLGEIVIVISMFINNYNKTKLFSNVGILIIWSMIFCLLFFNPKQNWTLTLVSLIPLLISTIIYYFRKGLLDW